jgi:large subunit ribosomal protein L1
MITKKLSKRLQAVKTKVGDRLKARSILEALTVLKDCPALKFDESIDAAINLGVDPTKSDQNVRGSVVLPKGTGRSVRVAVFAQGAQAVAATAAGAEIVGFEDLAEKIKGGFMDFDLVIATPDTMRIVGQLGQVLGPRGLMPNPKVGTVTTDVTTAVKNAKAGQVQYRTDKNAIIHATIGRRSFSVDALKENIEALLGDLRKNKPISAKGIYIKKVSVSSTMGPGLVVDQSSLASKAI